MKKMLVTGGTVFVSRYIAEYYMTKGYAVYVLNRNTKQQSTGVRLIEADRHALKGELKGIHFDVVVDVTAYNGLDMNGLIDGLGSFDDYIMISSSAVYPETGKQPFKESDVLAENKFWGKYGTDKIEAEEALGKRVSDAYILRPPYLYGPMNNLYREAFVFECAIKNRPFYLPKDGKMKLQFFHVKDLCRFIDCIIEKKPEQHVFNLGNKEPVSVKEWVEVCYEVAGRVPQFVNVYENMEQRNYFSFYDYEYYLDVEKQYSVMPSTVSLKEGLMESYKWYVNNSDQVITKPFFSFIDEELNGKL